MPNDLFSEARPAAEKQKRAAALAIPDYAASPSRPVDHVLAFLVGFAAGAAVLFIFYKLLALALAGGLICGGVNIVAADRRAIEKRRKKLREQFYDMLEAMSVAMRSGNPVVKALQSARGDLLLLYTESADIIRELDIIIGQFYNAVPLSVSFAHFAERSGLEDVASFASVYATIEGKSSRADEIVRETQQIISDKMQIEMEIDTLMTAAKSEVNIMLCMPLVILGVIGYAGAGFMDAIYTTPVGRLVASGGLIVFCICYVLARKFSDVEV